jgi:DNA polymerase-3 subunit delta'
VLDLGLELCAAWVRDLGAVAVGAPELVLNGDRSEQLRSDAEHLEVTASRRCVELVQDTRRRLDLNVSEELALEALFFRLQRTLAGGSV